MPGYANLFDRLFESPTPLAIAAACDSPAKLAELGALGLSRHLRKKKIPHRSPSIEKVLAWAAQAMGAVFVCSRGIMHGLSPAPPMASEH
jgi:hypothetical protein